MGIKHKFQSLRADAPDNGDVHPRHWNEDHDVTGILGKFLEVAEQPSSFPYVKPDGSGSVTALSEFTRGLLALLTDAEFRAAIGAVANTGDAMTGALAMGNNRITGLGTPTAAADAVTKAYADGILSAVSGALRFEGAWDASAGTFPGAGNAATGAFYKVSVAGTVDGVLFEVGDDVFAIVDDASASDYADNWLKVEGGISLAEVEAAVGFVFGTAAAKNFGTAAGNLVEVQTGGKLPALDGSLLTNLPSGNVTASQISDASANGRSLITAANYAAMLVLLGIGTAGLLDTGTTANKVLKLDGSAKIPAVDGSQLTNLPGGATVGGVQFFPANAAPTGWLKANGALLSRTTYPALYAYAAASGNIVAEASWSTNKGAFSTGDTSTTFRIPDLRGVFVRGWDDSAGVDSGRAIGSSQTDDNKAHTHTVSGFMSSQDTGQLDTSGSGQAYTRSDTKTSSSSGGSEARPKNVALLGCIRYAA